MFDLLTYAAVWGVFTLADRYWWARWLTWALCVYAGQSVLRSFLADCLAGHPFGWSLFLIILVVVSQWWRIVGADVCRPVITARLTKWKAKRGQTPAS